MLRLILVYTACIGYASAVSSSVSATLEHNGHGTASASIDQGGHGSASASMDQSGHGLASASIENGLQGSASASMDHSGHGSVSGSIANGLQGSASASMDQSGHGSVAASIANGLQGSASASMDQSGHGFASASIENGGHGSASGTLRTTSGHGIVSAEMKQSVTGDAVDKCAWAFTDELKTVCHASQQQSHVDEHIHTDTDHYHWPMWATVVIIVFTGLVGLFVLIMIVAGRSRNNGEYSPVLPITKNTKIGEAYPYLSNKRLRVQYGGKSYHSLLR